MVNAHRLPVPLVLIPGQAHGGDARAILDLVTAAESRPHVPSQRERRPGDPSLPRSSACFAVIAGVPLVIYQGLAAGAAAPAPSWVSRINDVLPLTETPRGWRTIPIGGPEGLLPITETVVVLAVGVVLI